MQTIHSTWRDEDIVDLIPGLRDALVDPSKVDSAIFQEKIEAFLENSRAALIEVATSNDFEAACSQQDPHALANVLEKLESSTLDLRRAVYFVQLSEKHWAGQIGALQAPLHAMVPGFQGITGLQNQILSEIMSQSSLHDPAQLQAMMQEAPELQKFAALLARLQRTPRPNLEKIAQINPNDYAEAVNRYQQCGDPSLSDLERVLAFKQGDYHASGNPNLSDEERKQAFAEGLSGVMKFKQEQMMALGFEDTLAHFSFSNQAPDGLIDALTDASKKRMPELIAEMTALEKLVMDKIPDGKTLHRYTWDETQDIICATYAKLDPALGALARRAFDEGWVLAKSFGVDNPCTLGGPPVSQSPTAHPFMMTNFTGGVSGVLHAGHEMAHVLSNYIAGQKQGSFTHDAPMIVQESFSHFGELLLEQEMLSRADIPVEKARIRGAFLANQLESLLHIPFIQFEKDVYARLQHSGGAPLDFDEINTLFQKNYADLPSHIIGEKPDIRGNQILWHVVNQPPHNLAVYPITKIMAHALYQAFEKDPESFRQQYREVMEAGGTIGVAELWEKLLGKDTKLTACIDERLAEISQQTAAYLKEIETFPSIEKPPVEKAEVVDASEDTGVGHMPPLNEIAGITVVDDTSGPAIPTIPSKAWRAMTAAPPSQSWRDKSDALKITGVETIR